MLFPTNELILATSNPGKIKELKELLSPIACISQQELGITDAEETGLSFIENAILKARHASSLGKKPALADDSGLVVKALAGQPGIYSARFAGQNASAEDNSRLLLKQLEHIGDEKARSAYFYCAIAVVEHEYDPTPLIATGKLEGYITRKPQGTEGFGYDPVFYLPEYHCTVAELPIAVKNKISHRAQALMYLKSTLFR